MKSLKILGTIVLSITLFSCSNEEKQPKFTDTNIFDTTYSNNNEIMPVYTPEITEVNNTPQVVLQPVEPTVIEPIVVQASEENPLLKETILHFEYDSSNLISQTKEALDAHAQYLIKSGEKISLEGHTDERGTREYNMALGERRAKSVQKYLISKGVNPKQLEVISYGEERPLVAASNAKAWAQNRRVELHK